MDESGWPGVGAWIWSNREPIRQWLQGIYSWFGGGGDSKKSKPGILILGPGGVGKTTLAKLLAGEYDFLFDAPGDYDESLGIERYTLKDAPNVEVVVPPGQKHRREATWADLHADIGAGKVRGVILLSSYGYHSLGQFSYKKDPLYQGDKVQFLRAFLEDRRSDELSILRQLVPHLRASRKKLWLLTLVVKQDLWWPKRPEVERQYQQEEYGAEVAALLAGQDQRRLRHEFVFASLVISNFTTGKGEKLKMNSEGYDHRLHVESLRRLFEVVDALRNWESVS